MPENMGVVLQSLRRRIRTMHLLWSAAASDMQGEQVNYHFKDGVLPLACSFAHNFIGEDATVSWYLLGQESLWTREDWQNKVNLQIPVDASAAVKEYQPYPEGSPWVGISVQTMQYQRIGSWNSWREDQSQVIKQTEDALQQVNLDDLLLVAIPSLPSSIDKGYIGQLVNNPAGSVTVLEVLEATVYAHGLRHIGEVEYGRAIVGRGGLTM